MPLNKQNTFVIDTICAWLSDMPSVEPEISKEETQALLDEIAHEMGYCEPYNAEQRAINAMLLTKRADKVTCMAAWGFYDDYKNVISGQYQPIAA